MEREKSGMNVKQLTKKPKVVVEQSGMSDNVQIFKRKELPPEEMKKLRVAAYCRVSTDREEQESSLQIQMGTYKDLIDQHPDWELVDIYADPGISGTSVRHRKEFLRMIEDAKAGKIDLILAKSISRFARNTEDMLKYTRMLREIGVGVIFEKEKLDTRSTTSEMLLTIFAAFSQEESHALSEWSKGGIRNAAARGEVKFACVYGYTSKGKEKWIIVPEEAEVIRRMFYGYVKGKAVREIADELNAEGLVTRNGNPWRGPTICSMLQNEKYKGDYLFQKSYVDNYMTKKAVNNKDMKLPQYYITDNHEGIVPKEIYDEAQEILFMRNVNKGSNQYPYYGYLVCPECGTPLVAFVLQMQQTPRCWVCPGEGNGTRRKDRSNCKPFTIYEKVIDEAMRRAILGLKGVDGVCENELEEIKAAIKENGKIERCYLKTLVEKITFPDFEHMTVYWKDGNKTKLALKISGYWSHPYPKAGKEENGFVEYGGEQIELRRMENIYKAAEIRRNAVLNLEIIMPDEDEKIQIPIVNRGAGHGNHKNRKQKRT